MHVIAITRPDNGLMDLVREGGNVLTFGETPRGLAMAQEAAADIASRYPALAPRVMPESDYYPAMISERRINGGLAA